MFDDKEIKYLQDTDFLSTKAQIIGKVRSLLESIATSSYTVLDKASATLPPGTLNKNAKISKGENYLNLPYMVLDYPRIFTQESTMACRHMFWWGNFFSSTIHLQGKVLESCRDQILENLPLIRNQGVYFCVHEAPWTYHYQEDNYRKVDDFAVEDLEELIKQRTFLKFSRFLLIPEWQNFHNYAIQSLELFLQVIKK